MYPLNFFLITYLLFVPTVEMQARSPIVCYKLVLTWPISYCNNGLTDCVDNVPIDYFTIHGLWGYNSTSKELAEPTSGGNFDGLKSQLQSIMPELSKYWPNLHKNQDEYWLWRHEWNRHGHRTGMDFLEYFKLGLELRAKYDILAILKQHAAIKPDLKKEYYADEFSLAIDKGTKSAPEVNCNEYMNKVKEKKKQLVEVMLCFDGRKQSRDCKKFKINANAKPKYFTNTCGHKVRLSSRHSLPKKPVFSIARTTQRNVSSSLD